MPILKLDDRTLRALTSKGKAREDYGDLLTPGLRLRVTDKGIKTWSLVCRVKGQPGQVRKTYGPWPRITLAQAREMARDDLNRAARGEDPRVHGVVKAMTFERLAGLWIAHIQARNRSWKQDDYRLKKDFLPRWGTREAESIAKADVLELRAAVHSRGRTVASGVLATGSKLYGWAVGEGLVPTNPFYRVQAPGRAKRGTRWLDDTELRAVIPALLAEKRVVFASVILARILLGQRTLETVSMEWADTEDDWWYIPETIAKNKHAHRVYLIPLFRELVLDRLQPLTGGERYVFASRRRKGRVHEQSVTAACNGMTARWIEREIIAQEFDARDLRRTYVTGLSRLGVSREIRQRLINHLGGFDVIDAVYDQHDYDAEKQAAAMRWDSHLRGLLSEEKLAAVVQLRG